MPDIIVEDAIPIISAIGQRTKITTSVHSHVKNIGISSNDQCEPSIICGLVGQEDARRAMNLIIDLINEKKFAGKAILLAGPPGTGKSAIALAMSKNLGSKVPFTSISSSEIYSKETKKTEILKEYVRRSIGLRILELKHVYEGEVTELILQETENPRNPAAKSINAIIITLRASAGTTTLKFAPDMHAALIREQVEIGDVIYIQASNGFLRRLGKCDTHASNVDIEVDEYVPLPKGQVYKTREIIQDITLHDIDLANSKPPIGSDIYSLINECLTPQKTEITDRLRAEIDSLVSKYIEEGSGELIPGVLFIDECHMLDLECYAYLNRIVESENSPTIILATNRGLSAIQDNYNNGEVEISPHGIPQDFLDRIIIVKTVAFTIDEAIEIIAVRANAEKIALTNEALVKLGSIAVSTSLRYALQLLAPSKILSNYSNRTEINTDDIIQANELFINAKQSINRYTNKQKDHIET